MIVIKLKRNIISFLIVIVGMILMGCPNPSIPTISDSKAITVFNFTSLSATGIINEINHTITVDVPNGTDVTALIPTITHTGKSISPTLDEAQNFTSPVTYTVTAEDTSIQIYTVTVTVAATLSTAKAITAFIFTSPSATGIINETNHTIAVDVPNGTDVTSLIPSITHTGNSISPISGTAQNFSSPVTYTVTAEDTSVQNYTVTVTEVETFSVTFNSQGGSSVSSQTIVTGGTVIKPDSPTLTGNGFGGWYKEETYQNRWDFLMDKVNSDTTLYARWYTGTEGLNYTLINGETEYSVSGGNTNGNTIIVIPKYWNDMKVTSIKDSGFNNWGNMTGITIPDSVTYIGSRALMSCKNLTSITIPDSVTFIGDYAFSYCKNLTSITIPEGVTSIANSVFQSCTGLTSVTIPVSVTSIGNSAFRTCSLLTSITIPDNVTSIGEYAFYDCGSMTSATIGNSVISIGNSAFKSCSSLTSINIPDSVTSIGEWAFYSCTNLPNITIPSSVTSIGIYAFSSCDSLTSITIPGSVTSIENNTFYNCNALTSITIPQSVTSIGNSAFESCTNLTSITIPDSVISIGSSALNSCSGLTSITFPDGITSIGSYILGGCTSLTSVTFGTSVTSIEDCAFIGCTSLLSITIPDSVTSIGDSVFASCTSLTDVIIGSGITSIGDDIFGYCGALNNISMKPLTAPTVGGFIYSDGTNWTLHIYSGSTGYDVSPWTNNPPFGTISTDL